MHPAFVRMSSRVLSLLGQDSLLREEVVDPPRKIAVKHGVQFTGYGGDSASYRGDLVAEKSIAYVPKAYAPKAGDRLQHPDGDYDLDVLHKDDGLTMQFVLREHYTGP